MYILERITFVGCVIAITVSIAMLFFFIVLVNNDLNKYKGDVSATIVSAVVTDKYSEVKITTNMWGETTIPKTRYYMQVEYNGITEVFESISSHNVEIGDNIDVYLVVNEERSDRLVLNYGR